MIDEMLSYITSARQDQPVQSLMSNDFEYSEKFRKRMVEPSVKVFS